MAPADDNTNQSDDVPGGGPDVVRAQEHRARDDRGEPGQHLRVDPGVLADPVAEPEQDLRDAGGARGAPAPAPVGRGARPPPPPVRVPGRGRGVRRRGPLRAAGQRVWHYVAQPRRQRVQPKPVPGQVRGQRADEAAAREGEG